MPGLDLLMDLFLDAAPLHRSSVQTERNLERRNSVYNSSAFSRLEVRIMGIRNFTIAFLLVLALAATIAGCANSFTDQPNLPTSGDKTVPGPSATDEAPVLPDREPSDIPFIETPENEPVAGEVPENILKEIIADLVKRTGADRGDIQVVRGEAVVWNDGSLGCPKPGEFYIQIITPGFRVVLQAKDQLFDYHTDTNSQFILCNEYGAIDDPQPLLPIRHGNKPPKCKWPPCR
jgi:hypothetical protein